MPSRRRWSITKRGSKRRAAAQSIPPRLFPTGGGAGVGVARGSNTEELYPLDLSRRQGHSPKDAEFAKWHGESIGFWNGDALIIHTNQIRGWKGGVSEFSDNLEIVERYRRVGNRIEGEITLYDSEVFVR